MAKTDLEVLVLRLEAQVSKAEKDLRKFGAVADQVATRTETRFKKAESTIKTFGRTMALSLASGAAASALRNIISSVANLGDEAKRAGIGVEELQAAIFAVRQEGGSAEALVAGFSKLNLELGKAAQSGNDLGKILKANNVDLKELQGDPVKAMLVIADLMKNAANDQDRAVIGVAALGKGYRELVPFLMQGSEAIATSMQNARDLGGVISKELVDKSKEWDDKLVAMTDVTFAKLKAAALEIGLAIERWGPAIEKAIPAITNAQGIFDSIAAGDWRRALFGDWKGPGDFFFGPEPQTVNTMGKSDRLSGPSGRRGASVVPRELTPAQKAAQAAAKRQAEAIAKVIENLQQEREQLNRTDRERAIYNELAKAGIDLDTKHGRVIADLAVKFYDEQRALEDFIGSMDEARDITKGFFGDLISGLREGKSLTDSLAGAFQNLADKMIDRLLDNVVDEMLGKPGTANTGMLGSLFGLPSMAGGPTALNAGPVWERVGRGGSGLPSIIPAGASPDVTASGQLARASLSNPFFGDPSAPRGIRNNNFGNIEFGDFARRYGAVGSDGRFARFGTPDEGILAMHGLLKGYQGRGLNTVGSMINRWAPPGENDSGAYASRVAAGMGIGVNTPFSMNDPDLAARMMHGMIGVETGKNPFSPESIKSLLMSGQQFQTGVQNIAETAQTSATDFSGSFGPAIQGILSAITGGKSGAAGGIDIASILASLFGGSRDQGGPISPGMVYKVHKDELIMPRVPGIVVPRHAANGNVGGGMSVEVIPSKYFDVHVNRAANTAGARAIETGRRAMPGRMASYQKLGT